jgi:hypothetical protein
LKNAQGISYTVAGQVDPDGNDIDHDVQGDTTNKSLLGVGDDSF